MNPRDAARAVDTPPTRARIEAFIVRIEERDAGCATSELDKDIQRERERETEREDGEY